MFGSDFNQPRDILGKWQAHSPFRPWILDVGSDYGDRSRGDVARIAAELGNLAGLANGVMDEPEDATMLVAFAERRRFRDVIRATRVTLPPGDNDAWLDGSACIGLPVGDPDSGKLNGAVVIVGTDIPLRRRRHCLLEELYQSLGLVADTCIVRPSVICEADTVFELQPIDKLVLRTLYDSRLEPGMSREEAMPIAREIILELWDGE